MYGSIQGPNLELPPREDWVEILIQCFCRVRKDMHSRDSQEILFLPPPTFFVQTGGGEAICVG